MQRSKWVRSIQGSIPTGAIPVGHTETGEKLYAARLNHKNSITVGKVCFLNFPFLYLNNVSIILEASGFISSEARKMLFIPHAEEKRTVADYDYLL